MRMDSALNILSSTAWTSLRVMVAFSKSSWVTPENLLCKKFAAVTKQFQVVFRFFFKLSRCQVDEERLTACCSQRPSSQVWQKCRRWLSSLSRWPSLWSALGPVLCSTVTKTDLFSHCLHFYSQNLIWIEFKMNFVKTKGKTLDHNVFIIINERIKYAGRTNIHFKKSL